MELPHRQIPAQSLSGPILVANIGGTHVRFAVVDVTSPPPRELQAPVDFDAPFEKFTHALRACSKHIGDRRLPPAASIAVQVIVNPDAALLDERILDCAAALAKPVNAEVRAVHAYSRQ